VVSLRLAGRWCDGLSRLGAALPAVTARGIAGVVQVLISYYTHLIEGHQTSPSDLDGVLRGALRGTPERQQFQQLHLAHLYTQAEMERALETEPQRNIAQPEFIAGLHSTFWKPAWTA
jgi:hypothetical protein